MRKEYNKFIESSANKNREESSIQLQIERDQETFPLKSYPTEETIPSDKPPVEKLDEELKAIVTKCSRLYVHKTPSKTAEILCIIERGTVVTINQTPSDPDFDDLDDIWVPICVNDVVGYVMGEFLKEV